MTYVDGFVIAVPKSRLDEYKALARQSGKVWREHGAHSYVEAVAEDVPYGTLTSFPRAVMAKEDETVIFAWITYASRSDRDRVNEKAIADPRLKEYADGTRIPFDAKRMIFGGFEIFLEA